LVRTLGLKRTLRLMREPPRLHLQRPLTRGESELYR
jgi:hypothetical protein